MNCRVKDTCTRHRCKRQSEHSRWRMQNLDNAISTVTKVIMIQYPKWWSTEQSIPQLQRSGLKCRSSPKRWLGSGVWLQINRTTWKKTSKLSSCNNDAVLAPVHQAINAAGRKVGEDTYRRQAAEAVLRKFIWRGKTRASIPYQPGTWQQKAAVCRLNDEKVDKDSCRLCKATKDMGRCFKTCKIMN